VKDPGRTTCGYPVNIELQGDDYGDLIATAERMVKFLNEKNISAPVDGENRCKWQTNATSKSRSLKAGIGE
jgi:hypothetical protein